VEGLLVLVDGGGSVAILKRLMSLAELFELAPPVARSGLDFSFNEDAAHFLDIRYQPFD
jgi:hypothetical protein